MFKIPDPPGFTPFPDPLHQGSTPPTERMHPTMPMPDPASGELKVDPEIQLSAKGFDLTVSFFYSTAANQQTEWGFGRSASVNGQLLYHDYNPGVERAVATITRGDFGQQSYRVSDETIETIVFDASDNTGNMTTVMYVVDDKEYTEFFLSGMRLVYGNPVTLTGDKSLAKLVRVEDPSGNRQTYT
ncbi:MAG: hypothetical protein EON58_22955, partial [Alphaproteobacteria bacterium]